eukprot:13983624-Alexandrium_andersonii.AAC.1
MVVDQTAAGPVHSPTPGPPGEGEAPTRQAEARGLVHGPERPSHEPAAPGQGEVGPPVGSRASAAEASRGGGAP